MMKKKYFWKKKNKTEEKTSFKNQTDSNSQVVITLITPYTLAEVA